MVRATPNSRPVHPCVLSVWEGNSGGAEYSTWARLSMQKEMPLNPPTSNSNSKNKNNNAAATPPTTLPHLVTAQGSTLTVYSVSESTGKLLIQHRFTDLAGTVCFLGTLKSHNSDALLIGFAGYPRLSIVTVTPDLLLATSLIDLTAALQEASYGATTPLEQDLQASLSQTALGRATVSVILGGGEAVACLDLSCVGATGAAGADPALGAWKSSEPYLLPLPALSRMEASNNNTTSNNKTAAAVAAANVNTVSSIITGFGDILSVAFLSGYTEPTLVLLHSGPAGETWSGRLGRTEGGARNAMVVTAITVTVAHERSAVLWSTEVPTDAMHVYCASSSNTAKTSTDATGSGRSSRQVKGGCLVQCVNSIVAITNTGQLEQVLATNGWVQTSLPLSLQSVTSANPWPFPALSVALDGAELVFVNDTAAFVVLRNGQLYLLQRTDSWSLLPLYNTIGALGQVANVTTCPLLGPMTGHSKLLETKGKESMDDNSTTAPVDMGLIFVASRLGDSSLLGYALAKTSVEDAMKQEPGLSKTKTTEMGSGTTILHASDDGDDDYDRVLRLEEDALYALSEEERQNWNGGGPHIVPPSDDDNEDEYEEKIFQTSRRKRARLNHLTVVKSLTVLDSLTALGPLGPGCIGPLSQGQSQVSETTGKAPPALGATGYIYPCGYGSSGGVAVLTVPGRDDRTILAEADCINAKALFCLPTRGLVLLSMSDRTRFMKVEETGAGQALTEVDMTEWTSKELRSLFNTCELLAACERNEKSFCILVCMIEDELAITYSLVVVNDEQGTLTVETNIPLPVPKGESIRSVAPVVQQNDSGRVVLGYILSTGEANVVMLENNGEVQGFSFEAQIPMDMDDGNEKEDVTAEEKFYLWGNVVAIDVFKAPKAFFPRNGPAMHETTKEEPENKESPHTLTNDCDEKYDFDDEDKALYIEAANSTTTTDGLTAESTEDVRIDEQELFVAIVRQSGMLEIYVLNDLKANQEATAIWTSPSCSHGAPLLTPKPQIGPAYRLPKQHKVHASEVRFFFCGPSLSLSESFAIGPSSLCLAIETSDGDTMLYQAELDPQAFYVHGLRRIPLKNPGRQSKEQEKHFLKLRRKGIVKQAGDDVLGGFRHNSLFRFNNLSRQDGLFAATTRPMWFIAERGRPSVLSHRCRHMAPAGARPKPVSGFCAGILETNGGDPGFMTLHERVGRVGSQRLTVFSGILDLTSAHGIIPGGGYFVEKLPMGVTVRQVQFIDNPAVCGSRPLYAMLVSREFEEDLSALNDDGMTAEERERLAEDKENAKIKRQVEADLGGFDIEQEWVEEIEREDCFKVDTDFGGAPPIPKSAFSLWVVDAAKGWDVVDSFELEEFEHGLTMQVMVLSEFMAEPGSSTMENSDEDLDTRMFIAVGTGTVDKDGEDVSSKGRVVLLELTKPFLSSADVELNFIYEKKIFHGPVNSLSCLSFEGKNRLIIGAGADVNVEQWGNDKLTQVGFFRATMHVQGIKLFKNFFVLSDAYDSLYFLVWRESDKSLTLLAKDYDPIPVYATGLLSRGGTLDLVCHDDRQNLQFFQYAPGDAAARGGNKLVCRADFHLGSQTTDLQSHFCRNSLLVSSGTPASTIAAFQQQDAFFGRTDDDQRLGLHFGTTDGEYGAIIPLSEPVYWRLTALQSVMVNAIESDSALSQRAWRLYRRSTRRGGCRGNRKKGVIDGNLVMRFCDLAVADQEDLASAIGSTVDLILDNLLELRCSVMIL